VGKTAKFTRVFWADLPIAIVFLQCWKNRFISLCAICCFILCGCASSNVSRDVSSNIDQGVENTKDRIDNTLNGSIADSYQNSSQTAKGALIGGAAGGVAGAFSSAGFIPGVLVGSIFGASYGAYIDSNATIEDQLQNRGATIVVLGDHVLIVLPSARIFRAMTPRIKPDAYSTLALVTRYINSYTKMTVKISAFTNDIPSKDVALALSQEQAESISKFLTASGVDARLLYAVGYGGANLVQRNACDWADNDNYRIEITMEKEYGC
jgi:outer membrane lipoprotein SlyB